ncbi:M20 family metallopeptidase [Phreatobacter stygius]|uniref:M20 family metallopeptidase n=1 Tax=Phreatobacter stygius TaxID=1940610 RepID=A0A4D7B781_9HYPH|nr:M20 family metallopeptidase [Phreatobacter stygius]QCI66220.1 M20 family metallopeptidase [Phreatobacter stygius]
MTLKAATVPLHEDEVIEGIRRWVVTESPSHDAGGVEAVLDEVEKDFEGLPVTIDRRVGTGGYAGVLKVSSAEPSNEKPILVLTHVDTVHPKGTLTGRLPFRREGDKLYGPGLYDMKGGAYLAVAGYRALIRAGVATARPITFLFTPDEEVGSPTSRGIIEEEARKAAYVLVTEPARDGGRIVTARKGVARFVLTTHGRPAHAGARHQDGRSAIREMAHQILAVEGMTNYARGITTTVGLIKGGSAANVTPETCTAEIDLRVPDPEIGAEMVARIRGLAAVTPDVTVHVEGDLNRPPYPKTALITEMLARAQGVARSIGFDLEDCPMTGGGSDGNFTAALGVPTLDGLGIDGAGAHTLDEHGLVSSIVPRARLLAGLMETLR